MPYPWYKIILGYAELLFPELGFDKPREFSVPLAIGTMILMILKFQKWIFVEIQSSFTVLLAFVSWRYCKKFYNLICKNGNNTEMVS